MHVLKSLQDLLPLGMNPVWLLWQVCAEAPAAVGAAGGEFGIPAAPILIPKGPWKEVDGCVNAPKGFKAQGHYRLILPYPPHQCFQDIQFFMEFSMPSSCKTL